MKGKVTSRIGRRLLFSAGLALFAFSSAHAQLSWHIGATAGPQYTMMSSSVGKYDGKIGANGGLANELRLGPNFSIEMDNLISMVGAQRHYNDSLSLYNGHTVMYNYNNSENFMFLDNMLLFHYNLVLDGPVILPYDFEGPPHTWLTFFAGPSYNMVLSYKRSTGSTAWQRGEAGDTIATPLPINSTNASMKADLDSGWIQPDEIGLVVGAGINFRIGHNNTLGIEARYHKGFTSMDGGYFGHYYINPVTSGTQGVLYEYADIFTSAVSLNISYKIKLIGSKYE
jgi:hypothetical protein